MYVSSVKLFKKDILISLEGNKLKSTEDLLKRVLIVDEKNTNILNLLGLINYKYCNFNICKKLWQDSYLIDKNKKSLYYLNELQEEKSISIIESYYKALDCCENKDYNNAILRIKRVIKEDPNLIETYVVLSLLYCKKGKYKNAIESIEKAYELDKSNIEIEYKCKLIKELYNVKRMRCLFVLGGILLLSIYTLLLKI